MKNPSWPIVAIIAAILAAVVALAAFGRDTTALLAFGAVICAGIGITVQQGRQSIEQTNGRIGQLVALVEKQSTMLAGMNPPPAIAAHAIDAIPRSVEDILQSAEEEHG